MNSNGIILAGGRGSRLGPLAAQISKALVSVGQRPHVVHQILHLVKQGADQIVVVVSPETHTQVKNVIDRAALHGKANITFAVQEKPRGPVDAIAVGVAALWNRLQPTFVIMSDTYTEMEFPQLGTWFGEAPAPKERSFCYRGVDNIMRDAYVERGARVAVGVYRFEDTLALHRAAVLSTLESADDSDVEVPMSVLLNQFFDMVAVDVPDWLDLGDVISLAESRHTKFIVRDHHELALDEFGVLTKRGYGTPFRQSSEWLRKRSKDKRLETRTLFPQVYSASATEVKMEHIDAPTLSELWLYWPGRPDTWSDILERVISRVNGGLWSTGPVEDTMPSDDLQSFVFGRATQRVISDNRVSAVTSRTIQTLLHDATVYFLSLVPVDRMVLGHGDLNFSNILYSINTGAVKLIDPRGDDRIPLIYEFAKLRYSYHGGFSAITHGLAHSAGGLLPSRDAEIEALDAVIEDWYDLNAVQLVEGALLIAGSALHNDEEAMAMRTRGIRLLVEVMS